MTPGTPLAEFRAAYAAHRACEGRAHDRAELLALPYLATGPLARQWAVRARTYDAFVRHVLAPLVERRAARALPTRLLDLGAGNGWLCRRAAAMGVACTALDVRDDAVDGLGAAGPLLADAPFVRVVASFEALPVADASFDVVVFNASLHYATDLAATLGEARRVTRAGGRVAVLDSPFYARDADGRAMVDEKRRGAAARFGAGAEALLGVPAVEYLTRARLAEASARPGIAWTRRRVAYPLWYELRPLAARLRGRRAPSRFDLWEGVVP